MSCPKLGLAQRVTVGQAASFLWKKSRALWAPTRAQNYWKTFLGTPAVPRANQEKDFGPLKSSTLALSTYGVPFVIFGGTFGSRSGYFDACEVSDRYPSCPNYSRCFHFGADLTLLVPVSVKFSSWGEVGRRMSLDPFAGFHSLSATRASGARPGLRLPPFVPYPCLPLAKPYLIQGVAFFESRLFC